ncbi:MAG: hypothetical protein K6G23_02320, partial [Lachnospiraceae bacterium]|nr:hypothetical protein [Lachnospiraceae bacterium]
MTAIPLPAGGNLYRKLQTAKQFCHDRDASLFLIDLADALFIRSAMRRIRQVPALPSPGPRGSFCPYQNTDTAQV